MTSDIAEMVTTIGGQDRSWNTLDEGTDREYVGVKSVPTFNLNFKIYTAETIGSKKFTSWRTWINGLSLFAEPSIASKVNINAMANNFVNGAVGAFDTVSNVLSDTFKLMNGEDEQSMANPDDKEKSKSALEYAQSKVDSICETVEKTLNNAAYLITKRDDENRVEGEANQNSFYGAKLWKLRILPRNFSPTFDSLYF